MSKTLPANANLEWLKKTAKQQLRACHSDGRQVKLADIQLHMARDYGFPSWRAFKAEIDKNTDDGTQAVNDETVAGFLRHVGSGHLSEVRQRLETDPDLVNIVGPHPYWGGRLQALHLSIDTKRRDMFDLLLASGAYIDGDNRYYEFWSPLMLTVVREQPDMGATLIDRGARIGLLEALLLADDSRVESLLAGGVSAVPEERPSGSILGLARTTKAIDLLLDVGMSPEGTDQWGSTAIETLSRLGPKGRPLVLQMMKRGVSAEPAEYARLGERDALEALAAHQPETLRSDPVLMGAVDFGHHALVEWLLSKGASANARAKQLSRQTALHSAAWNGDLKMVKLLLANGADAAAVDEEHGTTPLVWAEVSVEVSNNTDCRGVAAFLEKIERGDAGDA